MKKSLFLTIALGFLASSCAIFQPEQLPVPIPGEVILKFVQVNDVYEIAPLNGGEYGGMARVAHIRDSIKRQFPNTYLFMAGDFLNPSLLGAIKFEGERLNGRQMVDVMNAMDFDLVTFGNHEFDLSESDLQKRLNESNFKWTSANVKHVTEDGIHAFATKLEYGDSPISDYTIFEAYGEKGVKMKFAIFGVTLPSNPKNYVYYGDIYQESERVYKKALEKSDVVFGLTHVSIEEDEKIAKRLEGIPLIMGGHEHNAMLVEVGKSRIAKADANAKSLYVHTIVFSPETKYYDLNSELVFIDEKIASQPKVERIVNRWNDILDANLKEIIDNPNEIIYNPKTPLDGTDSASRGVQTNIGELITKAMSYHYVNRVDACLVNGGSIRVDDMLAGPISSKDIFRILPFGGEIVKVEITGRLLTDVLDYGEEKRGTGAYLQRGYITKGQQGQWEVKGKSIIPTNIYTVVMTDFLLKGLDIPFLTPENKEIIKIYSMPEDISEVDIRRVIIQYLKS